MQGGNITADGTNSFSYSSENLLTQMVYPPKSDGRTIMNLAYDLLMRL